MLSIANDARSLAQLDGEPKVNVLDDLLTRGVGCEEKVVWFDITVDHQRRMNVLKPAREINDPLVALCDVRIGAEVLGEGSLRAKLHLHV